MVQSGRIPLGRVRLNNVKEFIKYPMGSVYGAENRRKGGGDEDIIGEGVKVKKTLTEKMHLHRSRK